MTPKEAGSVTRIIGDLKNGADEAVEKLWKLLQEDHWTCPF